SITRKPAGSSVYAGGMYFGYYLALGSLLPFISLYYERIGLTGVQIGVLTALPVLILSSTTLLWGAIADKFRLHKKILSAALLLTPLAVLIVPQTIEFLPLIPVILAYAISTSPIVPLMDSMALEIAEANRTSYGQLRVWGSIGWTLSTLLIGSLIEQAGIRIFFYTYAGIMGALFLLSFFQPARTHQQTVSGNQNFRRFFRLDIIIFLLSVYLISITNGALYGFFSIYMDGIGANESVIGLSWSLSSLSEIPVLIFSALAIRRIGSTGLLKISFIIYSLRWFLFAFINQPGLALLVQLLHGMTFGTFLVGSVTYMNERAPEGMGTTAQAVLNTVTFGLGAITGSLLGGYLVDNFSMSSLFLVLSGIAGSAFFLFRLVPKFYRE
ncbi:MAG: MFS transporter, partial [Chloroflexi bacterium]